MLVIFSLAMSYNQPYSIYKMNRWRKLYADVHEESQCRMVSMYVYILCFIPQCAFTFYVLSLNVRLHFMFYPGNFNILMINLHSNLVGCFLKITLHSNLIGWQTKPGKLTQDIEPRRWMPSYWHIIWQCIECHSPCIYGCLFVISRLNSIFV